MAENTAGLRGITAGETALCTVGQAGTGLTYRGYDIHDLAEHAEFEEVAHLLVYGHLPTEAELEAYRKRLKSLRELPAPLCAVLEQIPADAHPMDVMRTGCSMLGNLETEADFSEQDHHIDRMLATFPAIITYWYRYSHEGVRIDTTSDEESIGGHFLHLLHGQSPDPLHVKVMHASLILYAEHEFNASTFTARTCASTLSDIHSCITGAIGSLRGPLHGGANEAAMAMIEPWQTPEEAEREILGMLERKEKIMGLVMRSTARPTRAMRSSNAGRSSLPSRWVIPDCIRSPSGLRRSWSARKGSSVTPTSSMPVPITSWVFRHRYSPRFLSSPGSPAGRHMSKNSVPITASSARAPITPAPSFGNGCQSRSEAKP